MEERPKPKPPKLPLTKTSSKESPVSISKSGPTEKVVPSKSKKEFVLKPHLTDRPLRNNEVLVNLQRSMNEPNPKPQRRRNRQK